MAALGARGRGRGLDLAKLREIHLQRVGYEDVGELRVPGRHVEWRSPGKLPEGFVARTSFEDGKTILWKELLQDREHAVKILRGEAMHARRIAHIPEGRRGFYASLYRRSFLYHMREEAIAHAYAVRLQSGAGYGFTHAWQHVGVANLEVGGAGLLGLGTYFALRPDDQ